MGEFPPASGSRLAGSPAYRGNPLDLFPTLCALLARLIDWGTIAMRRATWTPAPLTLAVGIAVGVLGARLLTAQPPASFTETPLLSADLADVPGKQLLVSRLDTAPGWAHGRHYHAGHELVYVLEGSAILEVEGKAPVRLGPGSVAYMPPGQVHAGRNASPSARFKFLLIRIHEKGQPISVELGS